MTQASLWMQMKTAKRFDFEDDNGWVPGVVEIAQILAGIPRFNACTTRMLSVAEHSLLVCQLAQYMGMDLDIQRLALVHDCHECTIGDIPAPFKAMVGPTMKEAERRIELRFLRSLGFREAFVDAHRPIIKKLDLLALRIEQEALMAPSSECDWKTEYDAREVWERPSTSEIQWDPRANHSDGIWLTRGDGRRKWASWSELFVDRANGLGFRVD